MSQRHSVPSSVPARCLTARRLLAWLTASVLLLLLLLGLAMPVVAEVAPGFSPLLPRQLPIEPPFQPDPLSPMPLPPLPVPGPEFSPVVVEQNMVEAVIDGPVAKVTVRQVFVNQGDRTAEGEYVFPLPKDAAVSDFQMKVNGETLEGTLLNADEARRIYEEIVRRQRDPALLQYLDRGLFQANVFPIPPGERRELSFTYTQVLDPEAGLYRFNFPLPTRQYSAQPPQQVAVNVELRNQPGLRTIYSPHYPIRIDRPDDSTATVAYESQNEQPPADFDLYFGTDKSGIGVNLLSYKPAGEDGYFALLAAPSVEVAEDAVVARDLVLVVDVSGSMEGDKLDQAKAAVHYVLDQLNPEDRFSLIAFSSATEGWTNDLQPVTEETIAAAGRWIDRLRATGSTDINRALLEALAQVDAAGKDAGEAAARPAYVLFLTDGQPTVGERRAERIVDNAANNKPADRSIRLFAFGIGYDVNTNLLDVLGQQLGGRSSYVQPDQRIDEAVSDFYAQISTPVLADVALELGDGVTVSDVFPFPLPDLFAGEQLVVVGRYQEGGPVTVTLTGEVNGRERVYEYPQLDLAEQGGEAFVAKLWATRRIGTLLDQVRRGGADEELIQEIVDLSLRYGIVTPYTSYLVQEPSTAPVVTAPGDNSGGGVIMPAAPAAAAEKSVQAAATEAAAAAPAGAAAVADSMLRGSLQAATTVAQDEAVQYVNGRTFQRQTQQVTDGRSVILWVDTGFTADMEITDVAFGSEAYFDLLTTPGMAEWLAVGPQVVVVTGPGTAVRVTLTQE